MSASSDKKALMMAIRDSGKRLSDVTIRFHHLVSEKLGLHKGDHKYLDLLIQHGPMTAGKLAELSGLTTGAVTPMMDRLEKQNLIRRVRDEKDRRKVVAEPNRKLVMEKLGPIFTSLEATMNHAHQDFTDEELKAITRYMENSIEVFAKLIEELKASS